MKTKLQKILLRIHVSALAIIILNAVVKDLTEYSFASSIEIAIKVIVAFSGLVLFFFYLKPIRFINFYFSIYPLTALLLLFGIIIRGVFGALIVSILVFPFAPADKKYEENGITIYTPFQGFMAMCCTYHVKERYLFLFEKNVCKLPLEGEGTIDFENVRITSDEHVIEIWYSTEFDQGEIEHIIIHRE